MIKKTASSAYKAIKGIFTEHAGWNAPAEERRKVFSISVAVQLAIALANVSEGKNGVGAFFMFGVMYSSLMAWKAHKEVRADRKNLTTEFENADADPEVIWDTSIDENLDEALKEELSAQYPPYHAEDRSHK